MTIRQLYLKNFKCFKENVFPMAPLTVLAGENSSGKSTVLQSLALMHQAFSEAPFGDALPLNGQTISLGKCEDIINRQHGRDAIAIGLVPSHGEYKADFITNNRQATEFEFSKGTWWRHRGGRGEKMEKPFKPADRIWLGWNAFNRVMKEITYISADRSGPREIHSIEGSRQYRNVGPRGERTIWFLSEFEDLKVLSTLRKTDFSPRLIRQVEAWMKDIFPGFQMELIPVKRTNLATVGFLTSSSTGYLRPQNIGFGLSYTLPIFTACLGAKKGKTILVENPESNLHPRGQSAIGEFLARVAASGVQVILETHSDHVLNGVRKAVKREHLSNKDVCIQFFTPSGDSGIPKVYNPEIDKSGNLSDWPDGFFDQFDKDLEALTDWGE